MRLTNFLKQINEIFLEICWCHWRRLGAYAPGPVNVCSTDPEALILMTCLLGEKEERLLEIMGQWIRFYGHLIPIDRFKSLLNKTFPLTPPYEHAAVLKALLTAALPEGEKKRWNPILEIAESESKNISLSLKQASIESRKKLDDHEKIIRKNMQMAFRCLFGPGSRADICYLISVISRQKQNPFHLRISAP